jgi:DeoR/GlpR family transcriptional regulator of sugar metabolism
MLVKRLVIQKARTSVVMCTQEKLRCLMPYTFATMKDVDYLISDAPLPEPFQRAAEDYGTILL